MRNYSKYDVILVRYPFSDLSNSKIRPAVVTSAPHKSRDLFITPLTSKTNSLLQGEFVLSGWSASGLNVATALKRGVYTVEVGLVLKVIGRLTSPDIKQLDESLRLWFGF